MADLYSGCIGGTCIPALPSYVMPTTTPPPLSIEDLEGEETGTGTQPETGTQTETQTKGPCCTPVVAFWACPLGAGVDLLDSWVSTAAMQAATAEQKKRFLEGTWTKTEHIELLKRFNSQVEGTVVRICYKTRRRTYCKCYKVKEGVGQKLMAPGTNYFATAPMYLTEKYIQMNPINKLEAMWEECTCCSDADAPYVPMKQETRVKTIPGSPPLRSYETFIVRKSKRNLKQPTLKMKTDRNGKNWIWPCPN